MAINWNLKTFLSKKFSISRATEIQKMIKTKTGVIISIQNVCNYLNSKPKTLRLETIEIFCTAFDCNMNDFCKVSPGKNKTQKEKKLSFKNTPHSKRAVESFPNPVNY